MLCSKTLSYPVDIKPSGGSVINGNSLLWKPEVSVGSKGAGNLLEEGVYPGMFGDPLGCAQTTDRSNSMCFASLPECPMLAGVRRRMLSPSGCPDWALVYGLCLLGIWFEIEHQGRALKTHHTPNCSQCLALCSAYRGGASTLLPWETSVVCPLVPSILLSPSTSL